MSEAQADVKGAKLFVAQRKQSEDVNKVLVPPKYHIHEKDRIVHLFNRAYELNGSTHTYTCTHNLPKHFLTSRGQVAVNKPKRCPVEEEGDPNRSLVS